MSKIERLRTPSTPASPPEGSAGAGDLGDSARDLYHALLNHPASPDVRDHSRAFLLRRIDQAARLPDDLPEHLVDLPRWTTAEALRTGERYAQYLAARHTGAPRRYFTGRAHALWHLNRIAPTKLVDGAWLYGLLHRWDDDRLRPLLQIYLDEIGHGDAQKNHAALYRALMATHECDGHESLQSLAAPILSRRGPDA